MTAALDYIKNALTDAPTELNSMLELRMCTSLLAHRLAGGAKPNEAAETVHRYHAALRAAPHTLERLPFQEALRFLHAALLGNTEVASDFRKKSVLCVARHPNATKYYVSTSPQDVAQSLDELQTQIIDNKSLDEFDRAALTHFELIFIHPFMDGNGRLARILLTTMMAQALGSRVAFDLTRVMRGSFGQYNLLLRSERNGLTYGKWVALYHGFAMAESQSIERIAVAYKKLSAHHSRELSTIVSRALDRVESGDRIDAYLANALASAPIEVKSLLSALIG